MNKEKLSNWIIVILFFTSPLILAGIILTWNNFFPSDKPYESCRDYSKKFPIEIRKQVYGDCVYDENIQDYPDIYAP